MVESLWKKITTKIRSPSFGRYFGGVKTSSPSFLRFMRLLKCNWGIGYRYLLIMIRFTKENVMAKKRDTPEMESSKIESRYQPGLLRQCITEGISADAMAAELFIVCATRKKALISSADKLFFCMSFAYLMTHPGKKMIYHAGKAGNHHRR